jgi:hypothetical protein
MSLKSWEREFYPTKPKKSWDKIRCIEHSLRKWQGLTSVNLKRHQVLAGTWDDIEDELENCTCFPIDGASCALCIKYEDDCEKCVLKKCLKYPCDYGEDSPFRIWKSNHNPKPMIDALKKTLKKEKV